MRRQLVTRLQSLVVAAVCAASVTAIPLAPSLIESAPAYPSPTVPYATDDPNRELWNPLSNVDPQPVRGTLGADIIAQQNVPLQLQNSDLLAPPTTDHGSVCVPLNSLGLRADQFRSQSLPI